MRAATLPSRAWSGMWQGVGGFARRFYNDQCLTRASALAYTSLLSIVPLLALMFAVLKGLGVQHRLEPLLLSRLSLDQATTDLIISYIDNTNVSTLGTLGAATLVLTAISVLGTIEGSFNYIWRVTRERTLWRQVTDYLGVVLLTPFLLLAGVAITSAAQFQQILHWILANGYVGAAAMTGLQLTPIAINAIGIGILYAVMPNRRPAWRPLVLSAVIAGVAWHLVQWGYVSLQVGVARSSAVYGALAQLPVTLVWLYVSWAIVLAGAELAAILELGAVESESANAAPDPQAVALHLLLRAADEFAHGRPGVELIAVARQLAVEPAAVEAAAVALEQRGWLVAVDATPQRFVLARDPAGIELSALASLCGGTRLPLHCDPRARSAVSNARARQGELWAGQTLADVLGPAAEERSRTALQPRTTGR